MYCYTRTPVYILSLLSCVTYFQWGGNRTVCCTSADRASISLKQRSEGDSWGHRGQKGIRSAEVHKHVHTYTEHWVNTRKFSAFTPQLSSSFRVHGIYSLGIS